MGMTRHILHDIHILKGYPVHRSTKLHHKHPGLSSTLSCKRTCGVKTDEYNSKYLELHRNYEDNFWSTKMALKGASSEALTTTKMAYDGFLRNKANLAAVREQMESGKASEEQLKARLAYVEHLVFAFVISVIEPAPRTAVDAQSSA